MNPVIGRGASTRIVRTCVLVLLPVAVIGGAVLVVKQASVRAANDLSVACYGNLAANNYPSGVASASLASSTAVQASGTGLQLNTALTPFNAQHIVFPFDQDVDIKFVYRNAGASHNFGWFYLDQIAPFLNSSGALVDNDNDGVYDWFQTQKLPSRPYDGLWHISSGGVPDLLNSAINYSDGGLYPHMSNLLESLTSAGKGQLVFKLCDDDGDTWVYPVGTDPGSYPVVDGSIASDGIPDYDVNGNGVVGDPLDRVVDLGIIQGNREIVFFADTFYGTSLPNTGVGTGTSGNTSVPVVPFFTKNILNPDRGTATPGASVRKTAIGCSRDDSSCYGAVSANLGWLDVATIARLATPIYNNVNLATDSTVVNISAAADGSLPHFVVFPPATNPNLWLIGYEDLPYQSSDLDYNDVVFMVERTNGGQAISNVISTDIPAGKQSTTAISKLHVTYNVSFPAPGCTGVTGAQVKLYYSVDNGVTWVAIPEASLTTGDVSIDVLGAGQIGSQLKWRADFVSPAQACQPALTSFNMAYEAVSNGIFKYAAPIPLANEVYAGALETPPFPSTEPTPTRSDFSARGHLFSNELYDPTNANNAFSTPPLMWDSGLKLGAQTPDARNIYTSVSGVTKPFTVANGALLYPLVLPAASRTALYNAALVYDFNGDGVSNDTDAQFVLQWTRGWEYPSGITFTPTPSSQPLQRAWKLGPLHNSSPAIVGPPVRPVWIDGSASPPALVGKHSAYEVTWKARPTRAVVGAQDGMLHAFDAGFYRPENDPTCPAVLNRGCYATPAAGNQPYGTGNEIWAWLPPLELSQLKNNHPSVSTYLPGSNPHAEVDGSVSVDDIWDSSLAAGTGDFRTVAYAALGTTQRYITAVDMTTDTPAALWATDFTDTNFNGSNLSPSTALAKIPGSSPGYQQLLAVSNGLNSVLDDVYLYFINALTGATVQKIQLNTGSYTAQAYGTASYVNMVDSNNDGLVDRAYSVDTSGRIWKVDTTTWAKCLVASVGESVYSGMATTVASGTTSKVSIFVGGGSNPNGTGTVASTYHIFAYQDSDPVGTCSNAAATLIYTQTLPSGAKIWAAPSVGGTSVVFASASAASESVCASGSGALLTLPTTGNGSGAPSIAMTSQTIAGAPVSSLRVYDGHAFVNSVGGSTAIIGGSTWNNAATGQAGAMGNGLIAAIKTLLWQEF